MHDLIFMRCTHNADVAKLICPTHRVVVKHACTCQPSWTCVIGKDDELVLLSLVTNKVEALLYVAHHNSLTHCVDVTDSIWNVLTKQMDKIVYVKMPD